MFCIHSEMGCFFVEMKAASKQEPGDGTFSRRRDGD